jgi:hypothetical protein
MPLTRHALLGRPVAVVVDDVVDGIFELVVRPNAQRLGLLAAIGDGPSATCAS